MGSITAVAVMLPIRYLSKFLIAHNTTLIMDTLYVVHRLSTSLYLSIQKIYHSVLLSVAQPISVFTPALQPLRDS